MAKNIVVKNQDMVDDFIKVKGQLTVQRLKDVSDEETIGALLKWFLYNER